MRKINQLKAGSILSYINLAIGCIIPLLYTPVMLDILGQTEYGLYALSNSVISYLGLLSFGMGSAVIRYITRYRAEERTDDIRRTLGMFVVIYSCLSLLVCLGGMILINCSGRLFGKGLESTEIEKLKLLMIIMTASTAISFPLGVFSSVTVVYERYIFNKLLAIVETVLLPILNLVLLFVGKGSVGLALIGLIMQVANGTIFCIYNIKRLGIYPVFHKMPFGLLKEIVLFCAFIFLSSVVDMLYWATDKLLIGAVIGSAGVAVYNIGGTFTSMLQNMAHAISNVFSPRINIMMAKSEDPQGITELLIRIGRLQYLIVSLLLSGYIVFGREFVRLWAGPSYLDAYYVALLTMIPLAIPLIQTIAYTTIIAQNKHRFRSILYAIIAVVNAISTYLVLPYYGIIGAATCTAIAFVIGQGILMNIYYYKVIKLDIPNFWKNIVQMSAVPAVMIIGGILLLDYIGSIPSLIIFLLLAIAYTALFVMLSWLISMNRYEKSLFTELLRSAFSRIKSIASHR